jgi:hypothetical protein
MSLLSHGLPPSSDDPEDSSQQPDNQENNRDCERDVNKPAHRISRPEAHKPQDEKNDSDDQQNCHAHLLSF